MRYPYDINGFYTWNPIDTNDVLPDTTSVNPIGIGKPKILDRLNPDSGWEIGYTEEEKIYQQGENELGRRLNLGVYSADFVNFLYHRLPVPEDVILACEGIEQTFREQTLMVYPDFVFPDYLGFPLVEFTYRMTAPSSGTSVEFPEVLRATAIREVCINGQPVYSYSYNPTTRILSGINVSVGDHIKVTY